MYQLADRSANSDPATMSEATFERVLRRVREHVSAHDMPALRVVLHGGEPTLAGCATLARMAARLRRAMPATAVDVTVQTNAVRLTRSDLDLLAAERVRVGVSLDGDRAANDRHRRNAGGRSTFDAVERALALLAGRPDLFAGILCVVDLANDPVGTYESLLRHRPPRIDFLLPHGNWSAPPPGHSSAEPRYGAWLADVFDRWYGAPARETGIRFFEELIHLLLGGQSRTEVIGLSPVAVLVINVDGSYEQVDTLRSAYPGAARTSLNAFDHALDDALRHPAIAARQMGAAALAEVCRRCPVHRVCGGGYLPHRYRAGSGFANASVYCRDLGHLIGHVSARLRDDIAMVKGGRG
jgi:uncharacterized protein